MFKRTFFLVLICFSFGFNIQAQKVASASAASLILSDTLVSNLTLIKVTLDGSYSGAIQWQKSLNNKTWVDVAGEKTFQLFTQISATTYFRVMLTEGTSSDSTRSVRSQLNTVIMATTTLTVCDALFYDNGGSNGNYSDKSNDTLVLLPAVSNKVLLLKFGTFDVFDGDTLYVYDGSTTNAPLLGKYSEKSLPTLATATNSNGSLTLVFTSVRTRPGWDIGITCIDAKVAVQNGFKIDMYGFLDGAMNSAGDEMRSGLLELGLIPSTSPYAGESGFAQIGDTTTYTIPSEVLNNLKTSESVVDWIWIELRSEKDNTSIVASRPALILANGHIVEVDGKSAPHFIADTANYYVALRHRNHLGIMTADAIKIGSEKLPSINFSDPNLACYGQNARKITTTKLATLWSGDTNGNKKISAVGGASDVTPVTQAVLLANANTYVSMLYQKPGYYKADLNMDGKVSMVGSTTEITTITANVILHPENKDNSVLFQITEQLP